MNTWILLRGLTREARHWGNFPETFQREIPGTRVFAVDLPGNGEANQIASPPRVEAMADHCRNVLARQGIAPPYHLLALSLGGMVALSWAERYPKEVAAAVLINTSMKGLSPAWQRLRPAAWPLLLKLVFPGDGVTLERKIFAITSRAPEANAAVVDDWLAIRRSRPVSAGNAWRQLVGALRFAPPEKAPAARLLLLASVGDQLVDCRCTAAIAQHWKCAMAIHPGAGHDLPLDDGGWVAREMAQWLAKDQAEAAIATPVSTRDS